jgi:hypothetical protein
LAKDSEMKAEHSRVQQPIAQWNSGAREKYHHTVEPIGAVTRDSRIVVTGRVSGDFPGSPVDLEHIFRL